MPFVEFLTGVVAQGSPRKPGEQIELAMTEARLLVGLKRAKFIDAAMPVVIEPPVKPQRKARGHKAAAEPVRARDSQGQFEADDPSSPTVNEAWVTADATSADQ